MISPPRFSSSTLRSSSSSFFCWLFFFFFFSKQFHLNYIFPFLGTGIVSILLHDSPYKFTGLSDIATAFFILNIALFLLILLATVLRYTLFPFTFMRMLHHPVESIFLGTVPIALATIIFMICLVSGVGNWK